VTAVVLYFVIPGTASTTVLVWHSKAVAGSPSHAGGPLRLAGNLTRDHARNFGSLPCSGQGSSPPASRRMFSAATRLSLFASFAAEQPSVPKAYVLDMLVWVSSIYGETVGHGQFLWLQNGAN
jgi:hypothetical protein